MHKIEIPLDILDVKIENVEINKEILRRDTKELTRDDLEVLKWLFKHAPILKLAYKLCNELTAIFLW